MHRLYRILILFLIFSSVILGCSEDAEDTTPAARSHAEKGWGFYRTGDYAQALLSFERALNFDDEFADAYNGVGWSHLSLSLAVPVAQEAFQNAVRLDASNADAWLGLANLLYLRQKDASDFRAALRAADNAMNADAQYLFRHDYDSPAALHALKAACYYYLGESQDARQEVEKALRVDSENKSALALDALLQK